MTAEREFLAIDEAVSLILAHAGERVAVATPLGLGKPNHLLNALYRRIEASPDRRLALYTALSLDVPEASGKLERRFLGPFVERQFGADYPQLDFVADLKSNRLPSNVEVQEFYFSSGAMLGSDLAQRMYASVNYTFVARDLAELAQLDAIVQLVAEREGRYSLSCNPDLTLDTLDAIAARRGRRPLVIGVVHPDLPFLGGAAAVDASFFDAFVDGGTPAQRLFAVPRNPVNLAEYAIGLHASTLVRDGGTLQIGIGALSDAIVHALLLRHRDNAAYREVLRDLRGDDPAHDALIARCGGIAPFASGLYGASEMVMDGFMHLHRAGILTRRASDDPAIERDAASEGRGAPAGHWLKGAFCLGSAPFYEWLRDIADEDPDGIAMCGVTDVNQIRNGPDSLAALQRRDGRFFNTCMMATLLGAAISDALEDGRVVSGVGGQYNFVAMAHALADGRSVLLLRATRRSGRRLESNIRWSYGHTTIPRHLRDIFVTEYGVADLRGRSDEACIRAMLAISDAHFVDRLADDAKRAGKLPRDFRIPDAWRANTPEGLAARLARARAGKRFPSFPFGSDFDETERELLPALGWLKSAVGEPRRWPALAGAWLAPGSPKGHQPLLRRLGLDRPASLRERALARLVRGAIARTRRSR